MRLAFLILVLANLAFFAWARLASPESAVADPAPAARQIDAERLAILSQSSRTSGGAAARSTAKDAAASPAADLAACVEWGGFSAAEAPRGQSALAPLGLGVRLQERRSEETAGWWVYFPPQGSRPAAQKKAAELKALGIEDYFILQDDGPTRWALSLGVFRGEEAAQARMQFLRDKGVRTAMIGPRETKVEKIWLQIRNPSPTESARLQVLAGELAGTEVRSCVAQAPPGNAAASTVVPVAAPPAGSPSPLLGRPR